MVEAVDLFCGAGGLTAGLLKSGIQVKVGYDIEPTCQYAYEFNNQVSFIKQDIANITSNEVKAWFSKNSIRLLAGCAPCQPFSTYSQGRKASLSEKYPLLYHFARLIDEIRPEFVTMENVPDVVKFPVYDDFVNQLLSLGYMVFAQKVDCTQYGIPQTRKRHVLLASRIGNVELLKPTHTRLCTVRDTIADLEPLQAGEQSLKDPIHICSRLSELNLKRIKASKAGGTWRDWSEDLLAECHKKATGKNYGAVYGRMEWDKPAPTMTTLCYGYGNGRFGHPEQHRAISLREASLLQTFPMDYQFVPHGQSVNMKEVGRMIGNAVPVRLGEIIGLSFLNSLAR